MIILDSEAQRAADLDAQDEVPSRRSQFHVPPWPGGVPETVQKEGDEPAGLHATITPTPMGQGVPVSIRATAAYERWEQANVVRGNANGTVSAYAWSRLGDVTSTQFRGLASMTREFNADVRITNRQNLVFRLT